MIRENTSIANECEEAVDILNGIIQTQAKKLREYKEMMAIDHKNIQKLKRDLLYERNMAS
jgi:hypothetical protein